MSFEEAKRQILSLSALILLYRMYVVDYEILPLGRLFTIFFFFSFLKM